AFEGERHRTARNAKRAGNPSFGHAALVLEAQDLSYSSHRHSLGWHRLPRLSIPTTSKRRLPDPAVEQQRHPQGAADFKSGVAEIKSESVADFIPESVADLLRNQHSRVQRRDLAPQTGGIRRMSVNVFPTWVLPRRGCRGARQS